MGVENYVVGLWYYFLPLENSIRANEILFKLDHRPAISILGQFFLDEFPHNYPEIDEF